LRRGVDDEAALTEHLAVALAPRLAGSLRREDPDNGSDPAVVAARCASSP